MYMGLYVGNSIIDQQLTGKIIANYLWVRMCKSTVMTEISGKL